MSNYNMTFRLKVEWKAVILAKGQNSRSRKCTKSAFLTTNFGRIFFCTTPLFFLHFTPLKNFSPPKLFFAPPKKCRPWRTTSIAPLATPRMIIIAKVRELCRKYLSQSFNLANNPVIVLSALSYCYIS